MPASVSRRRIARDTNPASTAKSVVMTPEGEERAHQLFAQLFGMRG